MDLASRTGDLLRNLQREGFGARFHLPSADADGALSGWSSAHHALALRSLDPTLAADELRALYAACQLENGLVVRERPLAGELPADSLFIEPPVAAFAAARLVLAGDAGARDLLECASRQLDGIWSERLPSETNLPVILHPCESGTPGSPLFDDLVEWSRGEELDAELSTLARSAAACRFDPDRALRAGHTFVVEDPVFCGWFLLAMEEAERAWQKLGDGPAAQKLAIRSRMISEAIAERLWWESEEIFIATNRQRDEPLAAITAGGIVPAASQLLLEDGRGRRAVARHLAPGSALWGPRGISCNPIVRDRVLDGDGSVWRGNRASALTQYWAHLALVHAGRPSDARVARGQLEGLVEEHGFCEFYDAVSGEGGGRPDCTLPALLLEMRASEAD